MSLEPFDFGRFRELAEERLRAEPPSADDPVLRVAGDHTIEGGFVARVAPADARPAAVLVPVVMRDEPAVILTQRTARLREHAGQIAFPGGKIDRDDASPAMAALREAEEEIGLMRAHVTPLGYLDAYLSGTGFRITPLIGLVAPEASLRLNEEEVEEAFEVPLPFLMDPANHQRHTRAWQGSVRAFYAIPYQDRYIWGATAGIIRQLYLRLYGP